ncbi:hypothetical protein DID88_008474 [Monilinia fructigena]|uniref:Glucan endo-1,3-beta-D-glucosidase 1 n=1 Tax=Monilinia fructigena TaxID=38457 RepID=A0A395J5Y4_9HELO|nr:hypothetical protein DID88_008474 [Monilinia fructigena]
MKQIVNLLLVHVLASIVNGAPYLHEQVDSHFPLLPKNHDPVKESPTFGAGAPLFPHSLIRHPQPVMTERELQPKSLLPEEPSGGSLSSPSPGATFNSSVTATAVIASVSVLTTSSISGTIPVTVQVLPPPRTQKPVTTGYIPSILETYGHATDVPILTQSIPSPVTRLLPTAPTPVHHAINNVTVDANIFQPIDTSPPPSNLGSRSDHPVPRLGIQSQSAPRDTNKFYSNFYLGSQSAPAWTHPYSLAWSKGGGATSSWGMTIVHIDANQRVFGPNATANPASYFINPIGLQSLVISAKQLSNSTTLTTNGLTAFSVNVNLSPSPGAAPAIKFPLVQGMGFVTAIFSGATPILQSGILFRTLTLSSKPPKPGITKYSILLEDGKTWLLYAYSSSGQNFTLTAVGNGLVQANSGFSGIIQIAKSSTAAHEAMYDEACGAYPISASVSGNVNGAVGSYTLSFTKAGMSDTTLAMFALPHHLESFDDNTMCAVINGVQLATTTKGMATVVVADSWRLEEDLPLSLNFAPWSPSKGSSNSISAAAISTIAKVAASEISQNMTAQTNLNSMYYSGKALAKFAGIVYTTHDFLGDTSLAQAGLNTLKQNFALFINNKQQYPLVYESAWGGIASSASYTTGDPGADFGKQLLQRSPFPLRLFYSYFPVSRNFDWYHGHSWAHGLYETFDGKDQESSSEDSLSAYAIKMWGRTIGDANMEARGNLQLAITARSLQNYYLYESSNTVQPSNFIGNKAAGILFENKIDHTTYFGGAPEYVQGIHMLPLLPHSTLTRTEEFVTEEWNTYFSNGRVDSVVGGWRGILYANLAIVDPRTSWNFFTQSAFDASWLDGGASRTWYLALAAGLGGSP